MYNSYILGFLSLCLVIVMSGCDSQGPCEKNYTKASEVRACIMGSDQMAEQILRNRNGAIPTGPAARAACERECHGSFNPSQVPVSNDGQYFDELNNIADLFRACVSACQVRLEYENRWANMPQDAGCEQIAGPGGITRCY